MCYKTSALVLLFIIKVIIIIAIPIIIIFFSKYINKKTTNNLLIFDIILIILFIVLQIINNDCIRNSNISGIIINNYKNNKVELYEDNDPNNVKKIETNNIYKTNQNRNVYYFNINNLPLSDKEIGCSDKEYLKHYGDNIAAMATLLSSVLEKNIDPIEILDVINKNNKLDCNKGIDDEELLKVVSSEYGITYIDIDSSLVIHYIKDNDNIIMASINNVQGKNNLSCGKSNIILYKADKDNNISILDPNNKDYDYICPDNTKGYGSVITNNNNNKTITISQLLEIADKYYIIYKGGGPTDET